MVPEGWDIHELGHVSKVIDCKHRTPKYSDEGFPIVSPGNIKRGQIDLPKCRRVCAEELESMMDHCSVCSGDIVMGRNQSVGIGAYVGNDTKFALGQDTILIQPNKIDARFLYDFVGSEGFQRQIFRLLGGSTFARINLGDIRKLKVITPTKSVQKKIAEILTTWDRAIEVAEAQLDCARTQKRALMQQLLTGKRRFPEFAGQEWNEVRLGEVAKIIVSNVDKKSKDGEQAVRLCNYTDVYKREEITASQDFMDATATPAQIKKFGLRLGDVIITKDSETASDIAMPTVVVETADDLVCGYHLAIVRPSVGMAGRFLKFFFELPSVRYYFGTRSNGAIRFGLTIDGIEGAKIHVPSLDEQVKIASVIVDAEIEISDFLSQITKLRTEKKALMQQLLTGKRRVTV